RPVRTVQTVSHRRSQRRGFLPRGGRPGNSPTRLPSVADLEDRDMIGIRSALVASALGCLAVLSLAAQPARNEPALKPIEPVGVVNTTWKVNIRVNSADRVYKAGQEVVVRVSSEQDGYLYLFDVLPDGSQVCIFPNSFQKNNAIKAGQEVVV